MAVVENNAVLREIAIGEITEHPQNPSVQSGVWRDDVVERVCEWLKESGAYPQEHAVRVRPFEGKYQLVAGHHRMRAAREAGIDTVWAWVRDMDDDEAFMALALDNEHGEWTPLHYGLHALASVELGKGGAGRKGGLREYARQVGRGENRIREWTQAASVVKNCANIGAVFDRTYHLAAIHAAPQELWPVFVEALLAQDWTVADTKARVKEVCNARETLTVWSAKRAAALVYGKTSQRELERIDALRDNVSFETDKYRELWVQWFEDSDPVDIKEVQRKRIELEDDEAHEQDTGEDQTLANLVLADPPWQYDFAETDNRQIENQYPSATVAEICAHAPCTATDCVLLLWATAPKLREALEVMEAWGFEYKTHAIWDKEKIGMGYWFRGQHELLLVGTKGSATPPAQEKRTSSVFREPRKGHSEKPDCVYQWIESAFPESNKLEMYCRNPRDGWQVWGNEVKANG